jgi:hypothetical protein
MLKTVLAACAVLCALPVTANARPRVPNPAYASCIPTGDVMRPCAYQPNFMAGVKSIRVTMTRERKPKASQRREVSGFPKVSSRVKYDTATATATQIVSHPSGCPDRAFCGCGAAVRVFGRPVRDLWLAANWFRFPRAAPSSGMVAVRRHHVFVLEAHLGGNTWQVYDANSGGRRTRVHARSIAGYSIVNPHGGNA